VQLSDENGSFDNPTVLDARVNLNTNTAIVSIPENIPSSENYQVRLTASSPRTTTNELPVNISLHPKPATSFIEQEGTIVCASEELEAYQWYQRNAENEWEAIEGATSRCLDLSVLSGRIENERIVVTVRGFIGNRASNLATPFGYREPTAQILSTESEILERLSIYPNPTANRLTVEINLKEVGNVRMKLVDATGKEIYPKSFENMPVRFVEHFELESLPSGLYFLHIETKQGNVIRKIVKE